MTSDQYGHYLAVNVNKILDGMDTDEIIAQSKPVACKDHLVITKCTPNSQKQCEKATEDLFRLFKEFLLTPQSKYGHLTYFVCEFVESWHGIAYLSQVKAFQCDFKEQSTDR